MKESLEVQSRLDSIAFLAKTLSDQNRLRILLSIRARKKSVSQIVEELGLSQPLVSHHLRELRRALLVNVERSGPFVFYQLADSTIVNVVKNLDVIAIDLLSNRTAF